MKKLMCLAYNVKSVLVYMTLIFQLFIVCIVLQSCTKGNRYDDLRTGSISLIHDPAASNKKELYTAAANCILVSSKSNRDKINISKRTEVANLVAALYLLGMKKFNTNKYAYYLANYPYRIDRYNPPKNCYLINYNSIVYNWETGEKLPIDPIKWAMSLPSCLYTDTCQTKSVYDVKDGKMLKKTDHPNSLKSPPLKAVEKELEEYEQRLLARGLRDAKKACIRIKKILEDRAKQNCQSI